MGQRAERCPARSTQACTAAEATAWAPVLFPDHMRAAGRNVKGNTMLVWAHKALLLAWSDMKKRGSFLTRDAKSGQFVEWRAVTASVSDKGSVSIRASDALKSDEAKSQLAAVTRIREALTNRK